MKLWCAKWGVGTLISFPTANFVVLTPRNLPCFCSRKSAPTRVDPNPPYLFFCLHTINGECSSLSPSSQNGLWNCLRSLTVSATVVVWGRDHIFVIESRTSRGLSLVQLSNQMGVLRPPSMEILNTGYAMLRNLRSSREASEHNELGIFRSPKATPFNAYWV